MIWRQSWRMTWRDWRAKELHFLLLSLVVAVAALSAVGFFVDRLRTGLEQDAHQLLGADLVIRADQPIATAWAQRANAQGLQSAHTVTFPSMAQAGTGEDFSARLAALKAVSDNYPLRGTLRLSQARTPVGASGKSSTASGGKAPARGAVWVDPALLDALDIQLGDQLRLGERSFTVTHLIEVEPDRGASFMSFAPRVMLNLSDLAATGLVQDGSRVSYRLLLAGPAERIGRFKRWAEQAIEQGKLKGVHIESLEAGRPEMQATLERARQFLSLVSLLSAMLAAIAVAMAARRFMLRHVDSCAMLRCLGATQRQVSLLFLYEFLLVGLAGSALGVLIGFAAHFVLLEWLGRFLVPTLPPASWRPGLQGLAAGLLLLLGFAMPSILQLRNVPHNHVMRRESQSQQPATLSVYALATASFVALLLWQAGDLRLGALTAAGFLGACTAFALLGWLCLRLLQRARHASDRPSWRFAMNGLQRRQGATVVQVVALALGLMALLLLTVVRGDLVQAWQQATPADAPNQFMLNIQPEQKSAIEARLQQGGVVSPLLYPMIRGRLVQINDDQLTEDSFAEDRARRLVDREFNLSTMHALPPQNRILAGQWLDDSQPEASVEEGLARTLGLKLGDRLTFEIAGQPVQATVTSLRKLDWGSMRVNFFVILNPALLQDAPQTWITAFHLPAGQSRLIGQLTQAFPNLTVVDVGAIVQQVQTVIEQVVRAVEFLFLFTLLAGVLVLYAALASSQEERMREAGLLRALGATRRQLSQAQWTELALIGALSGVLAAGGAAAVGWALARFVFEFSWQFNSLVWLAGLLGGVTCAFLGGWFSLRQVLNQPPLQTLREAR